MVGSLTNLRRHDGFFGTDRQCRSFVDDAMCMALVRLPQRQQWCLLGTVPSLRECRAAGRLVRCSQWLRSALMIRFTRSPS